MCFPILKKFALVVGFSVFFQTCTAWPALTAALGLVGGDKGGAPLLLPPPGGSPSSGGNEGGSGGEDTVPQTPNSTTIEPAVATLTVNNPGPLTLYQGIPITPIIFTATGGAIATNGCILQTPSALPAGLVLTRTSDTTCTISGTPTVLASQDTYTVRAENPQGYAEDSVTFSVILPPPQNLNYPGFPSSFTAGIPISPPIVPTYTGVITNCTSSPALPTGMSLNPSNCSISGTPASTASFASYTITPSNSSGNGNPATIAFSIEPYPAVVDVTSPTANGAYKDGFTIPIHVVFNRIVFVIGSGTPTLALATGTPATTNVSYISGSGTNTLVFQYTVALGNHSSDLSYVNSSSLSLNGAFIRDSHNNDANLTLPIPGNPNSLSANKNLVIDTTIPVISGVSPASNANVNSTAVSYTLSETCASGFTKWTRIGGSSDPGSPHIAAWAGSELNSGTRTNIILTNNPTLVDSAIYDIEFHCTDPAGNVAVPVTSTNVTYTAGPPQIVSAETMDTNNNGKIDTYRLSFNKPVNDATFPGYVANSLGSVTTHWLVAGYSNVRMIHGTAVAFATDTPNDAVIYLRFNENPLECSVNTTVGCDTNAKPDLTTSSTPGLQDLATNPLGALNTTSVVEMDGAKPILVGAKSLGANLADALFSEPVNQSDAETVSNYSITPGITVTGASRDSINTNIVHLTTSNQTGGDTYTLTVATAVRDLANLNLNTLINPNTSLPANQAVFTGLVKPVVANIVTLSATTLRITFNEVIIASTAECATQTSCSAIYQNPALPVLSAVSELGTGVNSATFILTVNPMIEGQPYTTTVIQDTAQSYASGQKIGNTNNSATFTGDGKPNPNISLDTTTACPNYNTTLGVARRVVIQYDQPVVSDAGTYAANNPTNYSITGCLSANCTSGSPQSQANSVTNLGANKYAVDFATAFNTASQVYQIKIENVKDLTGNTVPLPGTFSFQCGNDSTPPSLISVTVVSATNSATVLILNFSESVDNVTANVTTNYKYSGNPYGFGLNAAAREPNHSQVRLTFAPGLPNGGHQLRVKNVEDLSGNAILDNGVNNVQPFIVNAPTGLSGGAVFNDPFNDGTPAANVVVYDGKIYVGADQAHSKLFETNFAMTMAQTITLDADGDLFNAATSSFAGYLTKYTGCATTFSNPPLLTESCLPKKAVDGVDTLYAACVGGTSQPHFTGTDCSNAGGTEYLFIGALRSVVNDAFTRSFFYTTTKSTDSTIFPFQEAHTGDQGGNVAFRSMNLIVFKDYMFANAGAEAGGGGRGGRVCMNPGGCATGQSFLQFVNLDGWSRMKRIGVNASNLLRNGSYNGSGAPYADPLESNRVLNAVSAMYEHDNDGPGGNESQLYIANGGFYVNPLPTSAPWERTGTSDGGIMRTKLAYSSKSSLPLNCPNDSSGCLTYWEDVTPDSKEKWSRYLSIPWPQNSSATGAANCNTSNIEMDCVEPYNVFIPALKAIPYMRTAPNGDLYLARNACSTKNLCKNGDPTCNFRTEKQVCPKGSEVPQLWRMSKNCGSATSCAADWELVAENGISGKTNMGNPNNSHISLLEVVGTYLYIGFDNPVNGANVWRVNMSSVASGSVLNQSNFTQVNIDGLGPDSGGSNKKLFGQTVVNHDGKNWLIITTRDGTGAVRIYRTANDEN